MRSLLAAAVLLLAAAPVGAKTATSDPRTTVRDAMVTELARSMERLKLAGFEAPYFIAYTVRDYDTVDIQAKNGAIFTDERTRARQAYVELRVGDYQFDNTAGATAQPELQPTTEELYEPSANVPVDDDAEALRGTLWLITDARYKAALAALNQKRGVRATTVVDDEKLPSFAKAAPHEHVDAPSPLVVDRTVWARRLRAASAVAKKHPDIFDSEVRLQVTREIRYLVNSEGARLITERTIWGVHVSEVTRADDGVLLDHGKSLYGSSEGELPDDAGLTAVVEQVAHDLEALRRAPVLDPYTGPAILMEEATGVLFHEVIGHRLEGERLADDNEGQTFKGQIGQPVIPTFLDVVDDPTQKTVGKVSLNGWYEYDDEGVPAQAVTLIGAGVLKGYLMSRKPVAGITESNGHGRAEGNVDPMARMGATMVRSQKQVPFAQLKQMLLDEVRKQGKPFGLIIRDITGGSTNTASYGYQAFKGTPKLVFKVDAKTGEETLVRGVEMVGTPLTSINKIVATGNTMGVFNGYCGAESGFVPVSTVAPAVLLTEIELERSHRTRQKATVLPPPWHDKK
jgi:predicted Zn-dependent protease